jgi:hypothetical protein
MKHYQFEVLVMETWPTVATQYGKHRFGQHWFNMLVKHRPDLSEQIRAHPLYDPFFQTSRLGNAREWASENWEKKIG